MIMNEVDLDQVQALVADIAEIQHQLFDRFPLGNRSSIRVNNE